MTNRPRNIQIYLPSGDPMVVDVSSNGWLLWKTKTGKTLDEMKRQQIA